jgi:hypothetical protein
MDRHYRNVGLVAVAMAQLEETAALIVYGAQGGWDSTYEHLKQMAVSKHLRTALDTVRDGLPAEAETKHVDPHTGAVRTERGELRRRLETFGDGMKSVNDERNRIVHSVVLQHPWDPEVLAVHAHSVQRGRRDAARPLPGDDEIATLVDRIDDLIREGDRLAIRIAATMDQLRKTEQLDSPR